MSSNAPKKSFINSYKSSISLIGDKLRDFEQTSKNTHYMLWASFSIIIIFMGLLGYIIFFYNPYKMLDYVQLPLIFIYLLIFSYILLFIFKTLSIKELKFFNFSADLFTHTKTYLKLLLIVVCIFIAGIVTYNIIQSIFLKSIQMSSLFTIIIMVLILSIINSLVDVNSSKDSNTILELLKNIVFYIPCLVSDAINFAKNDYKNTPTTTFILFIILVIIILIYAGYYFLYNKNNSSDIVLVDKATNLNRLILSLSKQELNEKIVLSRPIYERELYKLQEIKNTPYDISLNPDIISNKIPSYADRLTREIYKRPIEGFTNVISDETIPIHLKISDYNRYILQQAMWKDPTITQTINDMTDTSSNDIGIYVQSIIDSQTSAMSVYKSVLLYLATFNNSNFSKAFVSDLSMNNYNYSTSCWIYLNRENAAPILTEDNKNVIIKYGNRPSLYFNIASKELTLETIDSNDNIIVHYRTNNILYQRWNHIVINNKYGTTDLFINGNLVGSYKNIVDYEITKDDLFQVGGLNNNILGGIARVCYYQTPLSLSDIKNQYTNKPSF